MSCEANALASNLICGAYVRPSVAVCIAGSARTFHQPLVHRTARTNFIEAFGGVITVFAALKLGDERPDNLGTSVVGEDEKVINALKHVTPAVTRALKRSTRSVSPWSHRMVSSSSAPRSRPRFALRRQVGAIDRHDVVSNVDAASAKYPRVLLGSTSLPTDSPPPERCGVAQAAKQGRTNYVLRSMLGQLNNRRACLSLITRHERAHSTRFDYVIYSRPDVAWPVAMRPFCLWDLTQRYMMGDQVLMFPRAAASEVLEACQEDYMMGTVKLQPGGSMISAQLTRKNKPGVAEAKGTRLICNKLEAVPGPAFFRRDPQLASLGEHGAAALCANLTYANPCSNV